MEDTAANKKLKKFSLYPRKQINRTSHRNSYNYSVTVSKVTIHRWSPLSDCTRYVRNVRVHV